MPLFSRKFCGALLPFLLLMAGNVCAQAPNSSTDLSGYIGDLQKWSAGLARLPSHPQEVSDLRRSVPLKLEVRNGAQRFTISNAWLVLGLVHWEKQAPQRVALQEQMAQRLGWELRQAQELSQAAPAPLPQVARAQLATVLSRREFRFVRPPSWWDLMWARVWRWIGRQVERFLRRLHLKPAVSNAFSWVLLAVAFLLVGWMLWRNLRRAARGMTSLGLQPPASTAWGWREWADAAREAAAGQHYREAVHYCYWAAVFRLEQMGVWRLDAARTPREYLRLLPRDSQFRESMATLTRSLEMVWYGYRPVTPALAESALQEMENLGCNSPSIAATASY